jgi:uncharacterized protein YbjT (DUF2867 family)
MIVVAGGTGLLGRQVVRRLVQRGEAVRVLTRDVAEGREALGVTADQVELVSADVRQPATLRPGLDGADTVVAAVQGFGGRAAGGIAAVDRDGNLALVEAAAAAGVRHFVLLSIHDASPEDRLALGRVKARVETAVRRTSMIPTIVRPTAYMETWAGIIGGPILAGGSARVFGRGRNPINFVSAADVAEVVDEQLANLPAAPGGRSIEVVGPEDVTFDELIERFAAALGRPVPVSHVPTAILRAMAVALRPLRPVLADQAAAAVVLDTTDRTARAAIAGPTLRRGATTFDAVIRAMVARSLATRPAPANA